MWKSSESKIREQFHPRHLINFLENTAISDDDNGLDIFLSQWR
jgi:hypothetical protein